MNESKSYGPLIALVVIVILIAAGGVYALKKRATNEPLVQMNQPAQENILSDKVSDIAKDLEGIDTSSLDREMGSVSDALLKN